MIKFIHEILRIADGGLVAAAEMILQGDKYCVGIIDVDRIGGTAQAILVDFAEISIPEFV